MCFIAAMIPFKTNFGNLALILGFIVALYTIYKSGIKRECTKKFVIYFPILFFIFNLFSALSSKNIQSGIISINKNLLIVIIILTLIFLNQKKGLLKQCLTVFAVSSSLATLFLLIYGGYNIMKGKTIDMLFFHNFALVYDQHPVYFALYLALSIFSLTYFYLGKSELGNSSKKILLIFTIFILLIGLFLTASKAVIFVFFILYFVQLFSFWKGIKSKIAIIISFILIGLILYNSDVIKTRFYQGLEFNLSDFQPTDDLLKAKVFNYEDKVAISDLELRYVFLKIGLFHLINDGKFLFGYGVGDVQDHLDYYYLTYGLAPNWYEGFNVHNQYLQILITYGVFLFLLFCIYIIFSFYYAIKYKNMLHLFFLIMICFIFVFEVALIRNKGIVFFYFFNTLFFLNNKKFENSYFRN